MDAVLRYAAYPLLLAATVAFVLFALADPSRPGRFYGVYLAGLIAVMVALETLHPLRVEWAMTRRTLLRRDLPFLLLGAATLGGANYLLNAFAQHYGASHSALLRDFPLVPGVLLALYGTDFIWYWVHRLSHEMKGRVGRVLWNIHAAHHLPQQVYVFMHAVGHPINILTVRLILALPLILLGLSPEIVFVFTVFNGLQGMVSHFNVDSRVGWLNYFLMGTELHRCHHSADAKEAKNYAAVVTLWDQLFGTFYYRPGHTPQRLGVERPDTYPTSEDIWRVLALPFSARGNG
jgi:sterol desaturase/sphingolipid hydroxylase (fatty acid hydroxylase superfamily)